MGKPRIDLSNTKIIIVTHRSIMPCIPGDDLKKFVISNGCRDLVYIRHPLLLLEESWKLSSDAQYVRDGETQVAEARHFKLPEPILYIKDFIYTLIWALKTNHMYDLYFGMNNLNAFAGIVLKKLGRVRKVVYYTIDLYPRRFGNKFINWIYHKLDDICVMYCDEIWNVSPFLVDYREQKRLPKNEAKKQFTVPIGIWFDEMKRVPKSRVKKEKIVYVGHLKAFYGVEMAIRALPLILKKVPTAYLEIIGGGEQMDELKALTRKLGVKEKVKFHGWKEKKEAEGLVADGSVGLAPFNTDVDEKIKNADPAKIKDYMALGLPVVMTNASLNADTISNKRCGVIVDYSAESIANGVIKLLSNKKVWKEYRKNALEYIQRFDWNNIFSKNVSRLVEN